MTLESLLAESGPLTAQEISEQLGEPLESIYPRLTALEGAGIATLHCASTCVNGGWVYERLWNIL